ncbi:hypothetical protein [Acinetobacter sp. ME22]|jgi:hypothetical protein|nr:hypothetical protein [Acinetobacter sp. ME22]
MDGVHHDKQHAVLEKIALNSNWLRQNAEILVLENWLDAVHYSPA